MMATVGFHLHFGYSDMLNMSIYELEDFYDIAKDINKGKESR